MKTPWFASWFNEDYLNLYSYRDIEEGRHQVDFIIHELNLTGKERILDLGCGMGRHAILFAEKGFNVTGVDFSAVLIEKAQSLISDRSDLKIKFLIGDMQDLSKFGAFDAILSLFTSFGYFADKQNQKVLEQIHTHLEEEGKFFFDYLNPTFVIKNLIPKQEKTVGDEKVVMTYKIENGSVVKSIQFPQRSYREEVKLYDRETLAAMLKEAGFEVKKIWGDFEGNSLTLESPRQILYCVKK